MAIGTLTRGDDYVLKVTITEDGAAVDIAGDKIFWTVKTQATDTDAAAIHQDIDVVAASADATAGIHRIQIPNTLAIGSYHYDVQWKRDVSGNSGIQTIEKSTFTVTQDVTAAIT